VQHEGERAESSLSEIVPVSTVTSQSFKYTYNLLDAFKIRKSIIFDYRFYFFQRFITCGIYKVYFLLDHSLQDFLIQFHNHHLVHILAHFELKSNSSK